MADGSERERKVWPGDGFKNRMCSEADSLAGWPSLTSPKRSALMLEHHEMIYLVAKQLLQLFVTNWRRFSDCKWSRLALSIANCSLGSLFENSNLVPTW